MAARRAPRPHAPAGAARVPCKGVGGGWGAGAIGAVSWLGREGQGMHRTRVEEPHPFARLHQRTHRSPPAPGAGGGEGGRCHSPCPFPCANNPQPFTCCACSLGAVRHQHRQYWGSGAMGLPYRNRHHSAPAAHHCPPPPSRALRYPSRNVLVFGPIVPLGASHAARRDSGSSPSPPLALQQLRRVARHRQASCRCLRLYRLRLRPPLMRVLLLQLHSVMGTGALRLAPPPLPRRPMPPPVTAARRHAAQPSEMTSAP
jgi:hypothetical protein